MKRILLLIIIGIPIWASAQKKGKDTAKVVMPIKNGIIHYELIIDSLTGSKEKIFDDSKKWMANTFVDSKEVIQINDKENGNLVGSGLFDYTAPGFIGGRERMGFMTEITVKDRKARIRIYQLRYMTFGSQYYGSNKRSSDSEYHPFDKKYISYLAEKRFPLEGKKYFSLINDRIISILNSYKTFLKSKETNDEF